MCGATRHSCNPFRNDHLPFFLRHRQARRRNQSVQQNGERRATLALCAILITTKKTGGDCYNEYQYLTFLLSECSAAVLSRAWTVDCYQGIWRLYTRIFWSVGIDKQERIGEFHHFKAILSVFAHSDDKVIIRKISTAQRAFFAFRQNMFYCLVVWLRNKISINKNI